ncbi:hypothetical protein [Methylobacterium sp. SyP6R]|uniref:hypothetical protein n=1 Tax=Methylobacterium sp. SyP6R TaxID=2718876 RepID=UPI001F37063E|nr:hypothetical protein [Methylobacterium sp. SyP6R]MCF4129699.1 hypothetical protein [Methylobacterium sp. SyP6R]
MRLIAGLGTRAQIRSASGLSQVDYARWCDLRGSLDERRQVRTARTCFRHDPDAYLAALEGQAYEQTLPSWFLRFMCTDGFATGRNRTRNIAKWLIIFGISCSLASRSLADETVSRARMANATLARDFLFSSTPSFGRPALDDTGEVMRL